MMQIHLTFDYELFFGSSSGTVDNCIIKPTERLIDIAKNENIPLVFYVDAGFLYQLKQHLHLTKCKNDYDKIAEQLIQLKTLGYEIGLHIHPHWEDCKFENNQWHINTSRYKLASFNEVEVEDIITKYHQAISDITGVTCKSYRAGGWCVQPFGAIKKALMKNNIFIDSSVYYMGLHLSPAHSYDFTLAKNIDSWKFDDNPCIEASSGQYTEIAITPDKISPIFYWNLYFKMKTNPQIYKPVGDGSWLVDKKRIYKHFYSSTNHFACADGYFASRLNKVLLEAEKENRQHVTILSHPKSMAPYSFDALEEFIKLAKSKGHTFTTIA